MYLQKVVYTPEVERVGEHESRVLRYGAIHVGDPCWVIRGSVGRYDQAQMLQSMVRSILVITGEKKDKAVVITTDHGEWEHWGVYNSQEECVGRLAVVRSKRRDEDGYFV